MQVQGGRDNRLLYQRINGLRDISYGSVVTVTKADGTKELTPATYFQYSVPGRAAPNKQAIQDYQKATR